MDYFWTMIVLQNIKDLRKKKGFSQKYMAEKLHISISGYGKIELGENVLSVQRLLEICKILGVTSYNQILPVLNTDSIEELEKILYAGIMSFGNIHTSSMYAKNLVQELIENKEISQNGETVKDLELISSSLKIIDGESVKHGYNFRSITGLLGNVD